MYQVIKRDGSLQPFDREKIINGVVKSGASDDIAKGIASSVEDWLPEVAEDNKISCLKIRDKVLEELDMLDPTAAESFRSYQK